MCCVLTFLAMCQMTLSKHDVISRMFHSHTLAGINKELKEFMDDKPEEKSDAVRDAWVGGAKCTPSARFPVATNRQHTSNDKKEEDTIFGSNSEDDNDDEDHATSDGEESDAGHIARV